MADLQTIRDARAWGLRTYADWTARAADKAREDGHTDLVEVLDVLIGEMRGIADRYADGTFPSVEPYQHVPQHLIAVTGLTDEDQRTQDPTTGVQFAVLDPSGERSAYGDQRYVAYGDCIQDGHPDGKIQRRDITITYGEWTDHHG